MTKDVGRLSYDVLKIKYEQQQELLVLAREMSSTGLHVTGGRGIYGTFNSVSVEDLSEAIKLLRKAIENYDDKIMDFMRPRREKENE